MPILWCGRKKKNHDMPIIVLNRRAQFDYEILETYEAGVKLTGQEVKSIRLGKSDIQNAYVVFRGSDLYLINAHIPAYQPQNAPPNYDPLAARKILLHKKELNSLAGKLQKSLTLIPLKVYTKGRILKIEIGLARGRKKVDKREVIKKREIERQIRGMYRYRQ